VRLLRGLGSIAARTGAEVTCVFDGAELGGPVPVPQHKGVRVLFSRPGEIADELIRRLVAAEPQGRPLIVVSSDREVADGVRRSGARPVPSAMLVRALARADASSEAVSRLWRTDPERVKRRCPQRHHLATLRIRSADRGRPEDGNPAGRTAAERERSDRRIVASHRRVRGRCGLVRATRLVCATVAAVGLAPAVVHADPLGVNAPNGGGADSPDAVRQQVAELYQQAEADTQAYDATEERIARLQAAVAGPERVPPSCATSWPSRPGAWAAWPPSSIATRA